MTSHNTAQYVYADEPPSQSRRIGELLLENGLINKEQLDNALSHQAATTPRRRLGSILADMGAVRPEQVTETLAEYMGIPYTVVIADMVQPYAFRRLPTDYIEEHNLLPLAVLGNQFTIVLDRFYDLGLVEDIERRTGLKVQIVAAESENIYRARHAFLGAYRENDSEMGEETRLDLDQLLGDFKTDQLSVVNNMPEDQEPNVAELATIDSPIIKLVDGIIHNAVEARASDIHIEPSRDQLRVRYRIDGDLTEKLRLSSSLLAAVISRIKILAGLDISERRLPQDGSIGLNVANRLIELRVSTMATRFGEKAVLRIVDHHATVDRLDALGLEPDVLHQFRTVVQDAHGIVIVTGPTGSGKTTTLYAALTEIISDKRNISTIEDPVERRLDGTSQFQVNNAAGFTFARALRSLLRQDPDVVMVGEVRDTETAKLATEAALTGHLVLTTLHTNDAITAVPRLVNMGVEPYLVAAALRGVLAQRLVRRLCPNCTRPVALSTDKQEMLAQLCGGRCPLEHDHAGTGCAKCSHTGFVGRVGVFELLLLNESLLTAMARDPGMNSLRALARSQGQRTLLHDGVTKAQRGLICIDSLLEIVCRADALLNDFEEPASTHTPPHAEDAA